MATHVILKDVLLPASVLLLYVARSAGHGAGHGAGHKQFNAMVAGQFPRISDMITGRVTNTKNDGELQSNDDIKTERELRIFGDIQTIRPRQTGKMKTHCRKSRRKRRKTRSEETISVRNTRSICLKNNTQKIADDKDSGKYHKITKRDRRGHNSIFNRRSGEAVKRSLCSNDTGVCPDDSTYSESNQNFTHTCPNSKILRQKKFLSLNATMFPNYRTEQARIPDVAACRKPFTFEVEDAGTLHVIVENCCVSHCTHQVIIKAPANTNVIMNFTEFNVPGMNLLRHGTERVCDEYLGVAIQHVPRPGQEPEEYITDSYCGIKEPGIIFLDHNTIKLLLRMKENKQCVDVIAYKVDIFACLRLSLDSCTAQRGAVRNSGYITSPGLAEGYNYPNNLKCRWEIEVPKGKCVKLDFVKIKLRPGDAINVHPESAEGRQFPTVLAYCDQKFLQSVVLPSNKCVVTFNSDDIVSDEGFNLTYTGVDPDLFIPMFPDYKLNCSDITRVPNTAICNFYPDCARGEDEENCPYKHADCSSTAYFFEGHCYEIIIPETHVSWLEAENHCLTRQDAYLLTVNTVAERSFLDKLRDLIGHSLNQLFLGLTRRPRGKQIYRRVWEWSDGKTAFFVPKEFRFESWSTCSMLSYDYFHTTDCNAEKENVSFICEKEIGESRAVSYTPTQMDRKWSGKIDSFLCNASGEYIALYRKCDKVMNCLDGSDEADCDYNVTARKAFLCDDSSLVPYSLVCNGINDCPDDSDETFCRAPTKLMLGANTTMCSDGMLLPASAWCNGIEDCLDGSDEQSCTFCAEGNILCPLVGCLPLSWTVDDEIDCPARDWRGQRVMEDDFKENMSPEQNPPGIVNMDGYGKFSITPKEETDACPPTHFHCLEGYCIPVYLLCNGVVDCPHAEDEQREVCDHSCVGMYKCMNSHVCVHDDNLCDGHYHCPFNDDETLCKFSLMDCPDTCHCERMELKCDQVPPLLFVKFLDLSGTDLNTGDASPVGIGQSNLIFLNISNSGLKVLNNKFFNFLNLRILDAGNNWIHYIDPDVFKRSTALQTVLLNNNKLNDVEFQFLLYARNLKTLDLSFNKKYYLESNCFKGAQNLKKLLLRQMGITKIDSHAFEGLTRLEELDMTGNDVVTFSPTIFSHQRNIQTLTTDNFRLCCPAVAPKSLQTGRCDAPRDEISSCDDLLRTMTLRISLWIMAVLTIVGNIGVIVYRIFFDKGPRRNFRIIITCLSASDLIMGAYLVIIGAADASYRRRYFSVEATWKTSITCQIAGFLCVLSSETSAFFVLLVTLDRFLAIAFPMHRHLHFKTLSASVACALVWAIGITLAAIPFLPPFSHWKLYSQTSVGAPLPLTRFYFPGRDYSFAIFAVLNLIIFLFVVLGQILIILSVKYHRWSHGQELQMKQDTIIAKRLALVVATDCLCWFPISMMALAARAGMVVPGEMYVVATVFLLPSNSALNPFLYTANAMLARRRNSKSRSISRSRKTY